MAALSKNILQRPVKIIFLEVLITDSARAIGWVDMMGAVQGRV
jgi:hypothetical protein